MDVVIIMAVFVVGVAAWTFIFSRARERAEYEDAVTARLARYAGRQR